ncbi:UNVERIFIED_CONTAM: hypothetical protein GTU68_002173 [Idotea baltica]|nr:hypothetical protein [Idotea baltica]
MLLELELTKLRENASHSINLPRLPHPARVSCF